MSTSDNKLDDFQKPFSQSEAKYTMTTDVLSTRCEVCRYFKQKNIYDPCLIVPNDAPWPIVGGGSCDKFEEFSVNAMTPLDELGVDEYIEETLEDEEDEDAYKVFDAVQKLFKLLRLSEADDEPMPFSGFKLIEREENTYWIGWYSNNFEDKELDIFATEGFDFFKDKVDAGLWDLPELWSMHQSYLKHGKAVKVFRIGHFYFAIGVFDDTPLAAKFIDFYRNNFVTMSHGFFYDPDFYDNNVFRRWRTVEVSSVKPGREANSHFTSLELTKE